jgi:1-phosphofructokinase
MITTVTANPSLDRTMRVATIVRGAVHRADSVLIEPSGKGVNVALTLHAAGCAALAVLPVGGAVGRQLTELLADQGVAVTAVPVAGDVRSNVSVIEKDGTTTKFNAPGAGLTSEEVAALTAAALNASAPGEWLAWCGSLPGGFSESALADAVAHARTSGRLVALDSSGSALATVLRGSSDALPHLIKPNTEELSELVGRPLRTVGAVGSAARDLVAAGVRTVLVSMGGDGAILVEADAAYYGRADASEVVNTAGAGDAFLAGYLAASDGSARERLQLALRYGAAAVAQPGTLLTDPPTGPAAEGWVVVDELAARHDQLIH